MTFSITRTWYLFKMQWVENRKLYLLALLALIGIISIFLFASADEPNSGANTFEIGLFFSASVFTSSILSQFADKTKAVNALMLPASALEKTVVAIIYSMVVFPLLYTILIYPLMLLSHYYHAEIQGDLAPMFDYHNKDNLGMELMLFFIMEAFALFCSAMFRRFTYIKTVVLLCLILASLFALNAKLNDSFFKGVNPKTLPAGYIPSPPNYSTVTSYKTVPAPAGSNQAPKNIFLGSHKQRVAVHEFYGQTANPYGQMRFFASNDKKNVSNWYLELPTVQKNSFIVLFFLIVPLFWLLTCLRLKEKHL